MIIFANKWFTIALHLTGCNIVIQRPLIKSKSCNLKIICTLIINICQIMFHHCALHPTGCNIVIQRILIKFELYNLKNGFTLIDNICQWMFHHRISLDATLWFRGFWLNPHFATASNPIRSASQMEALFKQKTTFTFFVCNSNLWLNCFGFDIRADDFVRKNRRRRKCGFHVGHQHFGKILHLSVDNHDHDPDENNCTSGDRVWCYAWLQIVVTTATISLGSSILSKSSSPS